MSILNRLQSILFGGAIGAAAGDAMRPVLEPVKQKAWTENQVKVLDPTTAAELAAKNIIPPDEAVDEAARSGISGNRLGALEALAATYPGFADLDHLSNRKLIDEGKVRLALARHAVPEDWHDAMVALFNDLLSVADVAAGVQQGHLPNDDILPEPSAAVTPAQGYVTPPAPDGRPPSEVPLTQIDIDPVQEAAGSGIDLPRLKVLANLAGLPPGSAELLAMWNRNLISEDTVDAGLREGHLKTKWTAAWKRMRWAVLPATEYASAFIRGWVTEDEMNKGGALTGHTTDQMQLLWQNRGRPIAPVQAFTAIARGAPAPRELGTPDTGAKFSWDDFSDAIRRSDVQTRYIATLEGIFHAYPPLFQLGRLAQANALPEDRVRTILKYERYEQQDIDALVDFWYRGPSSTSATSPTTKAQGQVWTSLHRSYVNGMTGASSARATLDGIGITGTEQADVLKAWDTERAMVRRQLTPSQIRKAVQDKLPNIDTGATWTVQDAVGALQDRGYSLNDAQTFLSE